MYNFFKPLLFKIPAEKAHDLTIKALKSGVFPRSKIVENKRLNTHVLGLTFPNPVGLAAGFDKNAEAVAGLFALGFGFVEVGTVTPKPQEGNPQPRVFRNVKTASVINRMGFPNEGLEVFKNNIQLYRHKANKTGYPVGLNIGMNKDQTAPEADYTLLIKELGLYADYLTINVSSPNTPGLRDLQAPEFLKPFLSALIKEKQALSNNPPLLVKLAPDLDDQQITEIAKVLVEVGIDGVILTNTTLDRPDILPQSFAGEKGGLSGALVKDKSTAVISKFYKAMNGSVPIIGVGGVSSALDVVEKMRAGASLVQLYTGLVYGGPNLPSKICQDIVEFLKHNRYEHISELVGEDHRNEIQNHQHSA